MEEWKDIPNSLYYQVSSEGRIKRLAHQKWTEMNQSYSFFKEKILKPSNDNSKGYWRIKIWYYKTSTRMESVHRLVAQAFIPNPDNLPQVNHKDGNKDNNHKDNLEWCTNLDNMLHAMSTGLMDARINNIRGIRSHLNKYSEDTIRKIPDLMRQGNSYKKIGSILGIPPSLVSEVKSRRAWKHLGLKFPEIPYGNTRKVINKP